MRIIVHHFARAIVAENLLVFNLKSITLKSLKPVANTQKITEYRKHFESDFPQSVWQPPKLNI